MKKSEPVREQPKSEKIAGLIVETETRLSALASELAMLNQEHDRLAAAEDLDTEALESLRRRTAGILAEKDTLARRMSALQIKKSDAERAEAGQRLQQIAAAVEHLIESEKPALEAYEQAERTVLERAEAIASLHDQQSELIQEMVFLMEAFGFPRPVLPQLGNCPTVDALTTPLCILFSPLRNTGLTSLWVRKRQELNRKPAGQRHLPVQAHSEERPAARTTTIPVTPDHEEDHRPNRMQSLQRSD